MSDTCTHSPCLGAPCLLAVGCSVAGSCSSSTAGWHLTGRAVTDTPVWGTSRSGEEKNKEKQRERRSHCHPVCSYATQSSASAPSFLILLCHQQTVTLLSPLSQCPTLTRSNHSVRPHHSRSAGTAPRTGVRDLVSPVALDTRGSAMSMKRHFQPVSYNTRLSW